MMKKSIIALMFVLMGCNAHNATENKSSSQGKTDKMNTSHYFHKDLRIYLEQRAKDQDPEGLTLLGETYVFGALRDRDYEKAYYYFTKAADLGNMRAQNHKAWLLFMGRGIAQDKSEAQKLWQKSCKAGYEPACQRLTPRKKGNGNKLAYNPQPHFRLARWVGEVRKGFSVSIPHRLFMSIPRNLSMSIPHHLFMSIPYNISLSIPRNLSASIAGYI